MSSQKPSTGKKRTASSLVESASKRSKSNVFDSAAEVEGHEAPDPYKDPVPGPSGISRAPVNRSLFNKDEVDLADADTDIEDAQDEPDLVISKESMDDLMNISPSKDDGGISDSELFTPLSPFRPPEENPLLSPMVTPENSARRNLFKGDKDSEYLEYLKSTYAVEESPRVLEWRKNQKDAADYEEETKEEVQRLEEKIDKMEERDDLSDKELKELDVMVDRLELIEATIKLVKRHGSYIVKPDNVTHETITKDKKEPKTEKMNVDIKTTQVHSEKQKQVTTDSGSGSASAVSKVEAEKPKPAQAKREKACQVLEGIRRLNPPDPLDLLSDSDSDDDDQGDGADSLAAKVPDNNPNLVPGTTITADKNSNKDQVHDDKVLASEDVNKNPKKRVLAELENPFTDSVLAGIILANNMVCRRWYNLTCLDLPADEEFGFAGSMMLLGLNDLPQRKPLLSPAQLEKLVTKADRERAELQADTYRRGFLTNLQCCKLWNNLVRDDGLTDVLYSRGEGWFEMCEDFYEFVSTKIIPQPTVLHRIMLDGVRDNLDPDARIDVFTLLQFVLRIFSPGPSDLFASKVYCEAMSTARSTKLNYKCPDPNEPYLFLLDMIHRVVGFESGDHPASKRTYDNLELGPSCPEEEFPVLDIPGPFMLLQYWVDILVTDFQDWYDKYNEEDVLSMVGVERPLLARVIFKMDAVRWNKRCEAICSQYVTGITRMPNQIGRHCVRKVIGLLAGLMSLTDAAEEGTNINKLHMARFLSNLLFVEKMNSETLKMELNLLDPSWLSSAVATFYMCKLTGIHISHLPTLTDIVKNFVDIKLTAENVDSSTESDADDEEDEPKASASANTSADQTKKATPDPKGRSKKLTPGKEPKKVTPGKTPRKVNLKIRNQYGEYQLHQACKKRDLERLQTILKTPGVDVNVTDNNGNTPLHEAVITNSIGAVKLILQYVPPKTIDKFFASTKKKTVGRNIQYPNVMALEKFNESPIHYAVVYKHVDILKYIFDFLEEQELKKSPHFPTLAEVLTFKSDNKTLESYASDDETKSVISSYSLRVKERSPPPPTSDLAPLRKSVVLSDVFKVLLSMAIQRYIGATNLGGVYRTWKVGELDKEYAPEVIPNFLDADLDVPLHEDLVRYGPLNYHHSVPYHRFQNKPSMDVYRSTDALVNDIYAFESIKWPKEKLKEMDSRHPMADLPCLLSA